MKKLVLSTGLICFLLLLTIVVLRHGDREGAYTDLSETLSPAPEASLFTEALSPTPEASPATELDSTPNGTVIPELSFVAEFPQYGEARFVVAYSETELLYTFIADRLDDSIQLYQFPSSYLSGVHWLPNLDFEHNSSSYVDVNGDGKKDIVVLLYSATGNFPYFPSFPIVYIAQDDGFIPDDEISDEFLFDPQFHDGVQFVSLEDVKTWYKERQGDGVIVSPGQPSE